MDVANNVNSRQVYNQRKSDVKSAGQGEEKEDLIARWQRKWPRC